eukprot:13142882-Alexandrium_andersonii.AAC.1
MSASLVGSEMCIRDRRIPTEITSGVFSRMYGSIVWPNSPAKSCATSSASVSYTHLTLPTICSV